MSNFLHGLGGGLGRGIGRAIAYIIIGFLIYLVVHLLDLDPIGWIQQNAKHLLMFNVEAKQQTSNVTGSIYTDYNGDCTGGQAGYCILQTNGIAYKRSLNTTYSGVLNAISFELHYVMNSNYQYTLNINGMSTDFRNNSLSVYVCGYNGSNNYNTCSQHPIAVSFRFVSKSQLQIVFPVQTYETYKVEIVGSPLTGINTYGIKNMILVYDDNQADMSGVIENNNQNTTSIIDNNNSNTQDIIQQVQNLLANDEALNEKLREAQTCPTGPLIMNADDWIPLGTDNYYLDSNGQEVSNTSSLISPYMAIKPNQTYQIKYNGDVPNTLYACTYTANKQKRNCFQYNGGGSGLNIQTTTINASSYDAYLRVSIRKSRQVEVVGPVCNDWEREAQQILNDTMSDDSIDQSQADSFFNNFQDNDHGLSGIITLPLSTIQALTTSSCIALELPVPFTNEHFNLPCMSEIYQSKAPALYNMWQVVCYGLIGYWIATDIFKLVKGFKDPEEDKVEVLDL